MTPSPFAERARAVLMAREAPDARRAAKEFVARAGRAPPPCHFYLVTRDPRYTPVHKLRPMLDTYRRERAPFSAVIRALGLAPPEITAAQLNDWSELLYDSCNPCGRGT